MGDKAVKTTPKDLVALVALSKGASVPGHRFNRLCDLGLCWYESVITLVGTKLERVERAGITDKGTAEIAAYQKRLEPVAA